MCDLIKHDAQLWLVVFNSSEWCISILVVSLSDLLPWWSADHWGSKSLSDSYFIRSRPHHLKKTSGMQSKFCNLYHMWLHHETNEKTWLLLLFTMMNNHNLFYEIIQICWHVAVPRKWSFNYVLMWRVPNRFFRIWDWAYLKAGFQLVFRYILLGFLEWEGS